MQDIVACLAYPVAGTPHQYVMERAIAAAGLDCRYLTLEVAPDDLGTSLNGAKASGVLGVSLAPVHERAAGELAEGLTGDATWIKHVDLITWHDKVGSSKYTWGDAVIGALHDLGDLPSHESVVWGEGPAALAVAAALARHGYEPVTLITKTDEARDAIAAQLTQSGANITVCSASNAPDLHDDMGIIVLADDPSTERDATNSYDSIELPPETAVIELYRHEEMPELMDQAQAQGAPWIDSLEVLVRRLAIAFREWTGKDPDLTVMRESLEEFWNV